MPKSETPEQIRYRSDYEAQLRRIDREIEESPSLWLRMYAKRVFEEKEDVGRNVIERNQRS
jgi:hypothetical protein